MKFCKDCKHYRPLSWFLNSSEDRARFAKCAGAVTLDPVSGKTEKPYCNLERGRLIGNHCGPGATLFEPKVAP